jgi:hypothetical protein
MILYMRLSNVVMVPIGSKNVFVKVPKRFSFCSRRTLLLVDTIRESHTIELGNTWSRQSKMDTHARHYKICQCYFYFIDYFTDTRDISTALSNELRPCLEYSLHSCWVNSWYSWHVPLLAFWTLRSSLSHFMRLNKCYDGLWIPMI